MGDTGNIQTTRRNVGCDQDVDMVVFEVTDDTQTLALVQISMDTFCTETAQFQATGQLIDPALGPSKNNGQLRLVYIHEAGHSIKLFTFFDPYIKLFYIDIGQLSCLDFNMLRLLHELNPDLLDGLWHGS